ncbi:MAG TPA: signal recognition particle-docking protein FtsY [Methanobacterium sp.]|nr:signal recognition particle-docking protein FtsY [Methanobacterium sp.]HOI39369.1 signal recognition particle-docking protein FtsY [Methanobacterium sp.]
MFESLKKKFAGTIGKISDQISSEEEEKALADEKNENTASKGTKAAEDTTPGKGKEDKSSNKRKENKSWNGKEDTSSEDEFHLKENESEKTSRLSFLRRKTESKDEDSSKKDEKASKQQKKDSNDSKKGTGKVDAVESGEDGEEEPSGMFTFATHKTISEKDIDDVLFELELALLEGDVALEVAEQIVSSVKNDLVGRKIKRRSDVAEFTKEALKNAISDILVVEGPDLKKSVDKAKKSGEPFKIMFVGVNGTGKTTTISKIADHFVKEGYTPVIAASDTFRAGAIEQISHHADNIGVKIIRHQKGADPAAVAYDAVEHARAQKKELVLIDTAGRMQTNVNLMDEMKKIQRVVNPDIAIFVGDALTGNDAVEQARKFDDAVGIDGIILTKADADAKGGAALSIGHVINKPILYLGVGQGYGDIMEFHPGWMVEQVLGD